MLSHLFYSEEGFLVVGNLLLVEGGEECGGGNDANGTERGSSVHVGTVRVVLGGLHQGELDGGAVGDALGEVTDAVEDLLGVLANILESVFELSVQILVLGLEFSLEVFESLDEGFTLGLESSELALELLLVWDVDGDVGLGGVSLHDNLLDHVSDALGLHVQGGVVSDEISKTGAINHDGVENEILELTGGLLSSLLLLHRPFLDHRGPRSDDFVDGVVESFEDLLTSFLALNDGGTDDFKGSNINFGVDSGHNHDLLLVFDAGITFPFPVVTGVPALTSHYFLTVVVAEAVRAPIGFHAGPGLTFALADIFAGRANVAIPVPFHLNLT